MIYSKSRNTDGFTLVEVLVAVLIVALVITPLFMSETNIFSHAVRLSKSLQRTFMLKQFFIDSTLKLDAAKIKDKPTIEKKIDTVIPPLTVKFEVKKVEKEERFKKFPDLYRELSTVQWQEGAQKRKEALCSFVTVDVPKKEKK
jgi:prepilin-type N-terminal cleavage/methylation domain-containing protein